MSTPINSRGPNPSVHIYSTSTLQQMQTIHPSAQLGISALAISGDGIRLAICLDEPDLMAVLYTWRTGAVVVSAPLAAAAHTASFHPHDPDRLCTTGGGAMEVWRIRALWAKFDVQRQPGFGSGLLPAGVRVACHAWAPNALYIGTTRGQVFSLDPATLQPQTYVHHPAPPPTAGSSSSSSRSTHNANNTPQPSPQQAAAPQPRQPHLHPERSPTAQPIMISLPGPDPALPSAITCLAVNRDFLFVTVLGGEGGSLYSHGCVGVATFRRTHTVAGCGSHGVTAAEIGGRDHSTLMLATADAGLHTCSLPDRAATPDSARPSTTTHSPPPLAEVPTLRAVQMAEYHTGCVTALVAIAPCASYPSGHTFMSAGSDGSLRLWDGPTGKQLACRTFSSAQGTLASSATQPLVAAGSQTGVLRLVCVGGGGGGSRALQVTQRLRLHGGSIVALAFNPTGDMLACVGQDLRVWFLAIHAKGTAVPLGHITAQEAILSIAWPCVSEGDDSILMSTTSGGIMAVAAPYALLAAGPASASGGGDFALGMSDVNVKLLRCEAPLLHLVGLPGVQYGDLVGLGADRLAHKLLLPVEGAAWAGLKGRLHKSSLKVPAHRRAQGAIAINPSGTLIATGSADGSVATRSLNLATTTHLTVPSLPGAALHDAVEGGVSALCFDSTGAFLASGGSDGCLFVYRVDGGGAGPPRLVEELGVGCADVDSYDDVRPSEMTVAELRQRGAAKKVQASGAAQRVAVAGRLGTLRARLLNCIERNSRVLEIERLPSADFLIDHQRVSDLQAEAAQRVAAVRVGLRREGLASEVVAERLRAACLTSQQVPGGAAGASEGPAGQATPAGPQLPAAAVSVVAVMVVGSGSRVSPVALTPTSDPEPNTEPPTPLADGASAAFSPSTNPQGAGNLSPEHPHSRDTPDDPFLVLASLDALTYSDFELTTTGRKRSQAVLLQHRVHLLKTGFNAEFEALRKQRLGDLYRISDLTSRAEELIRDLGKLGLPTAPMHAALAAAAAAASAAGVGGKRGAHGVAAMRLALAGGSSLEEVLSVGDEEVDMERFVSDEEGARLAATRCAEAEAQARKRTDNASERALRAMMGGSLAAAASAGESWVLPRPEWMSGNPKMFTAEQMKEVQECGAKEKVLWEERARRAAVLEAELRSTRGAIDDTAARHDDALGALHARRLQTSFEVLSLESRIISLAINLQSCASTSEAVEKELYSKLNSAKEARSRAAADLSEKRSALSDMNEQAASLAVEEKALDRNFKKEFADTEGHHSRLLQLYRHRTTTAAQSHAQITAPPANRKHMPLDPHDTPYGTALTSSNSGTPAPHALPSRLHPNSNAGSDSGSAHLQPVPSGGGLPNAPELQGGDTPPEHLSGAGCDDEPIGMDPGSRPEGLDIACWERFVAYRGEKVTAEAALRSLVPKQSSLRQEVVELEAKDAQMEAAQAGLLARVGAIRAARRHALYNQEVALRLKAGQVEVKPTGLVSCDMSDAVFLHRAVVESVNGVVRAKGDSKIARLRGIKAFKVGIYRLEWENRRCDMMVEDLKDRIRTLQLLHVTRDIQVVFKEGEDRSRLHEAASIEALMKQRDKLHAKSLADRQQKLLKLGSQLTDKAAQNAEAVRHSVALGRVLQEQTRLTESMGSPKEVVTRRMRSLVTIKKLKEIAGSQSCEVVALRAELSSLRGRTYPTFMETALPGGATWGGGPDTRPPSQMGMMVAGGGMGNWK
ncbi:MAG: hypothetical protein WDW36_006825 [Sanguina aurantia]